MTDREAREAYVDARQRVDSGESSDFLNELINDLWVYEASNNNPIGMDACDILLHDWRYNKGMRVL